MPELGHIVFYVRSLDDSVHFYREVVGLELVGRIFEGRAAMLSGGRTHHELLLIEVGEAPAPPAGRRLGLYHVGWKVGESLAELRAARERAEHGGYPVEGMADHTVSQSLYLRDPDGNEVELYIDVQPEKWRDDPTEVLVPTRPLVLGR